MYLKSPFMVICGQGASAEVQRCWSNLCSLSDGRHETSLVLNLQNHPKVTARQIDFQHCLMPILTSPDWIVGVSMENLCLANGSWVDSRVVDLYPWDAGAEISLKSNSILLSLLPTRNQLWPWIPRSWQFDNSQRSDSQVGQEIHNLQSTTFCLFSG